MKRIDIDYKGVNYNLVFNLNVMEEIQEEYGSIEEWGKLTDGQNGEPNFKAMKFGLQKMINEGIDIDNEDNKGNKKYKVKEYLSLKEVGRLLTDVGFDNAVNKLNETVIDSTKSDEKN